MQVSNMRMHIYQSILLIFYYYIKGAYLQTYSHTHAFMDTAKISREYSVNMLDLMRCIRERLYMSGHTTTNQAQGSTNLVLHTLTGMADTGVTAITSDIPRVTVSI